MQDKARSKFKLDGHIHTLECGHAYNTITEMAKAAKEADLEMICWTEHGPELGSATPAFFSNMHVIPPEVEGVRVLKGIEANIRPDGTVDIYNKFKDKIEVASASLHFSTFKPRTLVENTEAVLEAIKNPYIDWICHLGNPEYDLDYETIVKEAAKYNKLIEVNNGSFYIREGSKDNCINIARLCKKYDVPIIVGTDAHWSGAVGKFPYARKALDIAEIPDELIINTHPETLIDYLKDKGKPIGYIREASAMALFDDELDSNEDN